MRFTDEACIRVHAGDGGDGCLSFRRERFRPRGGPDGGNGGKGGDVILRAEPNLNTLVDFSYSRRICAGSGGRGRSKHQHGHNGNDLTLSVPLGTQIYDEDSGDVLGDLRNKGDHLCVAQGGTGGLGNMHFKSSTNRAPRYTTEGVQGQQRSLRLVLTVLADVGLLGKPNAGKSSLLAALSAARPKISHYAFTTLWPNLGVVSVSEGRSYVLADIPGLLPGAASGVGLGTRFLKHLNRTRLLLHVVDISTDVVLSEQVRSLQEELRAYSPDLGKRESWLLMNKCDLLSKDEVLVRTRLLRRRLRWRKPWFVVSALSKEGLPALNEAVMNWLAAQSPVCEKTSGLYVSEQRL